MKIKGKPLKKRLLKIAIISLIVIFVLPIFLTIATLADMYSSLKQSRDFQLSHIESLRAKDLAGTYESVNEQDFVSFDLALLDSGIKYNDLQFISSHNSYKQELTPLSKTVFTIFSKAFGIKEKEFEYSHPTITEQLNNGIRYIDLDTNYIKRKGEWEIICCHNPILDNKSSSLDFSLALEEIYLWSKNNPSHFPITIFIEPKSDYLFLPTLKDFGMEGMLEIDKMIADTFGTRLFTPADMLGEYENFKEMTDSNGWAEAKDMLGKVMFLTYPDYNYEYIQIDPAMQTQNMFMSVWHHSYDSNLDSFAIFTPFILTNNPDTKDKEGSNVIEKYLDMNLMVRTRLDFYPIIDMDRKQAGISSGAQILSTDFLRNPSSPGSYFATFEGGYTISLR